MRLFITRTYSALSFLFLLIIILMTINTTAQTPLIFTPAANDVAKLKSLAGDFEKRFNNETASLSSDNKKELLQIYKERWEEIKNIFDNKEIYTSPKAQQYLDALVAEIKIANPALQSLNYNCFFARTGVPNASYIGEGIILFNIGLFNKLQNESQVAFVLCHEISHFYLHHTENRINKYVALINSNDFQKELQKIKKTEFKQREELEKLMKGISFNSSRHSRDHESQADSMALEFMHNTKFDIKESLTALALLDSIDEDKFETEAYLEKLFNSKDYPFQKKWVAKEVGLLGATAQIEIDKALTDSLKTHPDCMVRVKTLQPMVNQYLTSTIKNISDQQAFQELKKTFSYEIIEYYFEKENYTKSLFYTLQLLQQNPSDPFLITQTGKIFNSFYSAQKNHRLGKVIEMPSPYQGSNYNLLLQFVQNLYLKDYSQISYNFLKQYSPSLNYYTSFNNIYNTSIQISQ